MLSVGDKLANHFLCSRVKTFSSSQKSYTKRKLLKEKNVKNASLHLFWIWELLERKGVGKSDISRRGENTLEFSVQIVRIPPPLPPPSPPYVSALDIMFNKKIPSVIEGSAERGGGMLDISLPP